MTRFAHNGPSGRCSSTSTALQPELKTQSSHVNKPSSSRYWLVAWPAAAIGGLAAAWWGLRDRGTNVWGRLADDPFGCEQPGDCKLRRAPQARPPRVVRRFRLSRTAVLDAVGCSLRKDGHEEVDAGVVDCSGQGDPATLAAAEGMSGVLNAGWRIRFLMVLLRRDAGVSRNSPGDGRRTSLVASIGRREVARGGRRPDWLVVFLDRIDLLLPESATRIPWNTSCQPSRDAEDGGRVYLPWERLPGRWEISLHHCL